MAAFRFTDGEEPKGTSGGLWYRVRAVDAAGCQVDSMLPGARWTRSHRGPDRSRLSAARSYGSKHIRKPSDLLNSLFSVERQSVRPAFFNKARS